MRYTRPDPLCYRIASCVTKLASALLFRRKFLRNELRGVTGPFVVIANHETALDFINLMDASGRPMNFVISRSIFSTLPLQSFLGKLGLIPKQQFQTSVGDLKAMKSVVADGGGLVIYPAGLMCEDGLSTPIPSASYKFLKWMGVDVYVARSYGTYFVLPKWSGKLRPGRTYMDIYKLFDASELPGLTETEIKQRTDQAMLFDAYREQDGHRVRYSGGDDIRGLENVLYMCPHCGAEFSMTVTDKSIIRCAQCGYAQRSDDHAMLRKCSTHGQEMRYVSDWSRLIYSRLKQQVVSGEVSSLTAPTAFHMLGQRKGKFAPVGSGAVSLSRDGFTLMGSINGQGVELNIPISNIPTLPFSPGRHFEVQHGSDIYRCVLEDGRMAMKFINLLKIFNELHHTAAVK